MAFSFTKDNDFVGGNIRFTGGTFTGTAVTTGELYTGLQRVLGVMLQHKSSAVVADQPAVDSTDLTTGTDPITIYFTNGKSGYWQAFGY
jgi:hypothetical protein